MDLRKEVKQAAQTAAEIHSTPAGALLEQAYVRMQNSSETGTPRCGATVGKFYREYIAGAVSETEDLLYILGYVLDAAGERG